MSPSPHGSTASPSTSRSCTAAKNSIQCWALTPPSRLPEQMNMETPSCPPTSHSCNRANSTKSCSNSCVKSQGCQRTKLPALSPDDEFQMVMALPTPPLEMVNRVKQRIIHQMGIPPWVVNPDHPANQYLQMYQTDSDRLNLRNAPPDWKPTYLLRQLLQRSSRFYSRPFRHRRRRSRSCPTQMMKTPPTLTPSTGPS